MKRTVLVVFFIYFVLLSGVPPGAAGGAPPIQRRQEPLNFAHQFTEVQMYHDLRGHEAN